MVEYLGLTVHKEARLALVRFALRVTRSCLKGSVLHLFGQIACLGTLILVAWLWWLKGLSDRNRVDTHFELPALS